MSKPIPGRALAEAQVWIQAHREGGAGCDGGVGSCILSKISVTFSSICQVDPSALHY